ncbi:MAG: GNAT family N-acetyltransferase [Sphingobacteriales bacterium]|nr:GNAT family N-acetyltransferase [Sphingobacteriales bacterium]MBI3719020.1 GNAT family N-acetyltransferase [Sphingobacteriales bacterium]
MLPQNYFKLDNPAWYALTEKHHQFAIGTNAIKKYQRYVAPWLAYHSSNSNILTEIDPFVATGESCYVFDVLPALPENYIHETTVHCLQMICEQPISNHQQTAAIKKIEDASAEELEALINLVQPGYYSPGTKLMGEYYGIWQDGKLVAAAGERICMAEFTEVSGVVTHPDYTGKKYAQQLVTHVTNKNFEAGLIPYLHVAESNERAIRLYEYLGFSIRRKIDVYKIKKLY